MDKLHDDQRVGFIDRISYGNNNFNKIHIYSETTAVDRIKELIDIGTEVYTYYKISLIRFKILSIEIGKNESGDAVLRFDAESTAYMTTYKNKIEKHEYWNLLKLPLYVEEN